MIDLDRFASEDIERVEIVRGSASALYGSDAIAGVINIITRRAKRPFELSGQGGYGAYGALELAASVGVRRDNELSIEDYHDAAGSSGHQSFTWAEL